MLWTKSNCIFYAIRFCVCSTLFTIRMHSMHRHACQSLVFISELRILCMFQFSWDSMRNVMFVYDFFFDVWSLSSVFSVCKMCFVYLKNKFNKLYRNISMLYTYFSVHLKKTAFMNISNKK